MRGVDDSLNEKDQRHYAALEAKKLCHGGITYIAELLNCARPTIYDGLNDFRTYALTNKSSMQSIT